MMKLRVRSVETRETSRIEVPVHCSLQQLKLIISQTISSSSSNSSSTPPDSVHLSLNRKEEITSCSPNEETLQYLGIASGDLIFFSLNPNAFSSETLRPSSQKPISNPAPVSKIALNLDKKSDLGKPQRPPMADSQSSQNLVNSNLQLQEAHQSDSVNFNAQSEESMDNNEIYVIEDEAGDHGSSFEDVGKSFSVPGFLRKVFTEELGGDDDSSSNHKLLVIAVHAVLLESGYVGFDMNSKIEIKGFPFRNLWPSNAFGLSLFYTLPEIISDVSRNSECLNCVIGLKFQTIGKFMMIYGSLIGGSVMRSLRLNEDELVSFLNVVWANCGLKNDIVISEGGILGTSPEREVFKFWRTVKDNLALPLLIDLCEEAGFVLPPCFMRLPTDLKLKILESLQGVDVAKVSCVSSELRYLASSDDLWKQKFVEQFGDAGELDEKGPWKEKFARFWESRKRRKVSTRVVHHSLVHPRRIVDPISRFPRWPGIIGGDYDLWPQIPNPFGGLSEMRLLSGSHVPHCQFGRRGNMNLADDIFEHKD